MNATNVTHTLEVVKANNPTAITLPNQAICTFCPEFLIQLLPPTLRTKQSSLGGCQAIHLVGIGKIA